MDYKFSNRMNLLKGSEIRELMALTARPEVISFAGGMPAPELFPCEAVKEACVEIMDEMGQKALQ
ncbi:MAG: aminotransferase, partial [Anaerotignum sp.]|nr:aminotransferase [Anaerotignum sp.]